MWDVTWIIIMDEDENRIKTHAQNKQQKTQTTLTKKRD